MSEAVLRFVWWATLVGHLALFVRLRLAGLHRTYRFFSYYLLFRAVRTSLLALAPWLLKPTGGVAAPFYTSAYGWVWMATEPLLWFFLILVVLELYSLVLQDYKGLATLGRWVVLAGLIAAVCLFTVSLPPELSLSGNTSITLLPHFFAINRAVLSSLVVFLLIIIGFLAWCPVPLCRNVVLHCIVYAAYFLGMAVALVVRGASGAAWITGVNLALSSLTVACLAVWMLLLNPEGEKKTLRIRPRGTAQDEEALVAHLAAINSTLLRAARK